MSEINYKLDHKLKRTNADLITQIHEYDVDLQSSHIYLFGVENYSFGNTMSDYEEPGIEYVIANRFIRNLNLCMRVNPDKPILIHLKTCGGYIEEGMAIYDAIKSSPTPVTILNYSHARSMSSIIFQAGNKRVMMPNSHFMFHQGTMAIYGTVRQTYSITDFSKNFEKTMIDIYTESIKDAPSWKGIKEPQIRAWLKREMEKKEDVFLTAEQTVEKGFADCIFDYNWKGLISYTDEQLNR